MFRSRSLREKYKFMAGNVLVFSITDLLGNFGRSMVFPYASLYILALGGSAAEIGYVNSLGPLMGLIMFPLAGHIADQAGRVKLIVVGNVLAVIFVLMYVIAPSWELIAVVTALRGLLVLQFPAKSALIADSLAPENRGRGIAAMNTISSALAIFAPFAAGVVVDTYGANYGMRGLYTVVMALYMVTVFIHIRYLKETRPSGAGVKIREFPGILRETYAGVPNMLRRFPRPLRALTGVIILSFMANGVASPFWVVYVVEQIRLTSAQWGLILLIETAIRILMFIPAGMLVDRWGRTASLLSALSLSLLSISLFVFARSFVAVLFVRITVALAFATAIPACTALMADLVPRNIRGRVMAAIGQGGIMIGAAGGGTGGPAMGFLVTIPLMLSSLAGGFFYVRNPIFPWLFVLGATVGAILLTAAFIRDPEQAEV